MKKITKIPMFIVLVSVFLSFVCILLHSGQHEVLAFEPIYGPDLVVSMSAPDSCIQGSEIKVILTVKNVGSAPSGDFHVRLVRYPPPLGRQIHEEMVSALGPRQSKTFIFPVITKDFAQETNLTAWVDCYKEVIELNENNNHSYRKLLVKKTPFTVAPIPKLPVKPGDIPGKLP
jgi:subtilase family serine protease